MPKFNAGAGKLLTVALVVLVAGVIADYTDEELAALEELKEAGLLDDVAIDQLIEEYEAAYMGEEYDYDLEEDYGILDEASDRGGPRRRRKPGVGTRRFQRPTLFQMIQKRFFLGGGRPQGRPQSGYGAPKRPQYKPRPSYGAPKYKPKPKKKRPSYKKPKPSYHKPEPKPSYHKPEPKPSYHKPEPSYNEPENNDEYGSPQAPVEHEDEYGSPQAPAESSYQAPHTVH